MTRSSGGRRRAWAIGAVALGVATFAAVALRQSREPALAPNEAIAVIPMLDGIGAGTPVRIAGLAQPIGRVTHVVRRSDDLVLHLLFNRESGIDRRRGDGVTILDWRGEKSLVVIPSPSYEKYRTPSDTLFPIRRDQRRPASVHALLAGLYRGAPQPDSARHR